MDLIFWWMLLLWAAAFGAYWFWRRLLNSRNNAGGLNLPVAHSSRLTSLPTYVAALKRYRILVTWALALLSLGTLLAILLTARPASVSIITPSQQNRDIMLCLDDSGSVLKEDTALIDRFSSLVNNFNGQRFGLTLFDSSAVTIVPLNDDYALVSQQLKADGQAFKVQSGPTFDELTSGTLAGFTSGTSLVSDGLTSCILAMGSNPEHRSQSIILGTDNEVNGTPIVSMTQAIAMAKQLGIRVYVIDPGVSDPQLAGDHAQLSIVAKETGGGYYSINNATAVDSIIASISAQRTQSFIGLPQVATNDDPAPFLLFAGLFAITTLALLWRLEL